MSTELISSQFPQVDTRKLSFAELTVMNLTPLFRKDLVVKWDSKTSSKYIELLCLSFPLPSIYLGGRGDEKRILTGCEELMAVSNFVNDRFALSTSMDFLDSIEGKKYSELTRPWQRRIFENPSVTVHIIENFDRFDYQSLGIGTIVT